MSWLRRSLGKKIESLAYSRRKGVSLRVAVTTKLLPLFGVIRKEDLFLPIGAIFVEKFAPEFLRLELLLFF